MICFIDVEDLCICRDSKTKPQDLQRTLDNHIKVYGLPDELKNLQEKSIKVFVAPQSPKPISKLRKLWLIITLRFLD